LDCSWASDTPCFGTHHPPEVGFGGVVEGVDEGGVDGVVVGA